MPLPPQTLGLLDAARCLSAHLAADAVLILTETNLDWPLVRERLGEANVIIAADNPRLADRLRDNRQAGMSVIELPHDAAPIQDRLGRALLRAISQPQFQSLRLVIVVYNGVLGDSDRPEPLDSLSVIDLREHMDRLTAQDLRDLDTRIPVDTLRLAIDLATQIGREGREGHPVGTILVVGDTKKVLEHTRPLNYNPFRGYPRDERDLRRAKVREQIKELAKLDGAIIVNKDAFAVAGCVYLDVSSQGVEVPAGLGTRHWAAASVSQITRAVAVCVSQSTGTVQVFHAGKRRMSITRFGAGSRPHVWQNVRLDTQPQPAPPPALAGHEAGANGKP